MFCKKYILKFKLCFILYIFMNIFIGIIEIINPYIIGNFINIITSNISIFNIFRYSVLFVILNLIKVIVTYFIALVYVKIQSYSGFDLNKDIIEHLKKLPLNFFTDTDMTYLNQKINNDSNNIIIFSINIITNLLSNTFTIVISFILLFKINLKIGSIGLVLIITYLVLYNSLKKRVYERNYKMKEEQSVFFAKLQEQISNIKFIKIHNVNDLFISKLNISFKNLYNEAFKKQTILAYFTSIETILSFTFQAILFFIGGMEIINKKLDIGYFVMISSYFNVIIDSSKYFIGLGKDYQDKLVSYHRLNELINIKEQYNGNININNINNIKVSNLKFSYNNKIIIYDFNYEFKKNNIYCILGENGSGKSTFINLLLGIYVEQYEGNIFLKMFI